MFIVIQLKMQYPVRSTYILTVFALLVFIGFGIHKPAHLFDPESAALIFQQNHAAAMLFLGDKDQSSQQFSTFSQLSNQHPDIIFIYSRKGHNHYFKLLQYVGVQRRLAPILIYRNSKAEKFYYDRQFFGKMTRQHMNQFFTKSKQRVIQPYLRSRNSTEDLQDHEIQEIMKYLTYYDSYSLREVLKTSEKQLILVIYGKWCFYSQKLSPHFTEVAKRLKDNPNLLFGKIDGDWNQIQGFQPQQHPTITFWNKNKSKQPIIYKDRRSADDIINWIKQNTQYPWVQPLPAEKKIQSIQIQNQKQSQIQAQILAQAHKAPQVQAEATEEEVYQDQEYYDEDYYYQDTDEDWEAGDTYEEISLQDIGFEQL